MSARRTTRAGSRGTTASPAPSESVRRSGRRTAAPLGTALPPINTRETTSYGSSMAVLPLGLVPNRQNVDLSAALADIVKVSDDNNDALTPDDAGDQDNQRGATPAGASDTTNGTARGKRNQRAAKPVETPAPETPSRDDMSRSFLNESSIYGDGTFNQGRQSIHEGNQSDDLNERLARAGLNAQQANRRPEAPRASQKARVQPWYTRAVQLCRQFFQQAVRLIQYLWSHFSIVLIGVTFGLLLISFALPKDTYQALLDGVGQYVPYEVRYPSILFNEHDVYDLQKRVLKLEHDSMLTQHNMAMDHSFIEQLKQRLPDFVMFKKNRHGQHEIPADFWRALRDQIKQEMPILQEKFFSAGKKTLPAGQLSIEQIKTIASGTWAEFLEQNEAKLRMWQGENINAQWNEKLKESFMNNVLIPRDELIAMIENTFVESQKMVSAEVSKIMKQIDRKTLVLNATALSDQGSLSKAEIQTIATQTFKSMYQRVQLAEIAKAKAQEFTKNSIQRVNHFSPGIGAVIDPTLTSPTYHPGNTRSSTFSRYLLWSVRHTGTVSHSPYQALSRWNEEGDCWCSPARGSGSGAQFGVHTANTIYPDQLVLEHIPREATLNPDATPRAFELLAYGGHSSKFDDVADASTEIFAPGFPQSLAHVVIPKGWVRIGKWQYDPRLDNNVQAFTPQVDLKSFGMGANRFVVRALTNWADNDKSGFTCFYRVRLHGEVAEN